MVQIPHRCPVCGGRGFVPSNFYMGFDAITPTAPVKCRACQGSGIVWGSGATATIWTGG